jgi:NAD(P)H dehydrogenase (quinone)
MDKRSFLKEAGAASLAASGLLASRSSQAQVPSSQARVLIAYHSVSGNTEKMAQGVSDGATSVAGTTVDLKRVSDVAMEDLLSADAVIVGSPVYFGNVSGDVKTFLDNWLLKFGVFRDAKMRNKVAAAFVTGAAISNGKETAMQAIHAALLINQMVIVSAGGAFGAYGASATTGPDSPGIDDKELETARALGKRVAEFAGIIRRGSRT